MERKIRELVLKYLKLVFTLRRLSLKKLLKEKYFKKAI
jgi:hypothetical protein